VLVQLEFEHLCNEYHCAFAAAGQEISTLSEDAAVAVGLGAAKTGPT